METRHRLPIIISFFGGKYNKKIIGIFRDTFGKNTRILCTYRLYPSQTGTVYLLKIKNEQSRKTAHWILFNLENLILDLGTGWNGYHDGIAGFVPQQRFANRGFVGDGGHIGAGFYRADNTIG